MSLENADAIKASNDTLPTTPNHDDDAVRMAWSPATPEPLPLCPKTVGRSLFLDPTVGTAATSAPLFFWDRPSIFFTIVSFCDVADVCELMGVNKRFYELSSSDPVWKEMIESMNLGGLLTCHAVVKDYYKFFVGKIISTAALHGYYSFKADTPAESGSPAGAGFRNSSLDAERVALSKKVPSVFLLVSPATFGQVNHPIGRVQLLLKRQNLNLEVLQGSCRFSIHKRGFYFSCNAFASAVRGPVFSVQVFDQSAHVEVDEPTDAAAGEKSDMTLVLTPTFFEEGANTQLSVGSSLIVDRVFRPTT
ncbi:hypothetical protein, conserved [Angomonas deanei]|uniref:F-box domain-containing protein n=1 Tax=Angomonas deanei TaxID=59799 RepID=A0A7G2C5V5_9TRYP|nr:hypothetical protein, conserved [Angomonas deanei]